MAKFIVYENQAIFIFVWFFDFYFSLLWLAYAFFLFALDFCFCTKWISGFVQTNGKKSEKSILWMFLPFAVCFRVFLLAIMWSRVQWQGNSRNEGNKATLKNGWKTRGSKTRKKNMKTQTNTIYEPELALNGSRTRRKYGDEEKEKRKKPPAKLTYKHWANRKWHEDEKRNCRSHFIH